MANKKFWEQESATELRFYTDPAVFILADVTARIAELQANLALPDHQKALMTVPAGVQTNAEFDQFFTDELELLADIADFFAYAPRIETLNVADFAWMSPADLTLGPGTIDSVCGEEIGNEAVLAIDGVPAGSNWQHDTDHAHSITIDLGYTKRLDGIRFDLPASPGAALILHGIDVYVAKKLANLPDNQVGFGLDMGVSPSGPIDFNLTAHNGQFIQIDVASTDHASNHITIRDLEFRMRTRTFGL